MIQYVDGLHPDLLYCCNFQQGWSNIQMLFQRMILASEADKVLDLISSLRTTNVFNPRRFNQPTRQPPLNFPSQKKPLNFSVPVKDHNSMDIDIAALDPAEPMTAIRRICWDRKLCCYCLKTFNLSHRNSNTRKCPKSKATPAEQLALLKSVVPVHTVAAIEEDDVFSPAQQLEAQELV